MPRRDRDDYRLLSSGSGSCTNFCTNICTRLYRRGIQQCINDCLACSGEATSLVFLSDREFFDDEDYE